MMTTNLTIEQGDMTKLLSAASPDAALLYLYLHSGNPLEGAVQALHMSESRLGCAAATLRQLGLWQTGEKQFLTGERPNYSEGDVVSAMDTDRDFRSLYGEIQRLLGKQLNTEEMKIILGFVRYLGLSPDVISVLVCYCKDRARQRGSLRNPSLRTIEKEAYFWAEQGIDTMEEAAAFIQRQNQRNSQLGRLMQLLQIRGRNLTPGEEKYARQWLEMGFEEEVLRMAYDKTCLNTGGLSWAYMNRILTTWHESGWHTAKQIEAGDKKPSGNRKPAQPKGASGQLGAAELEAIRKAMKEDN